MTSPLWVELEPPIEALDGDVLGIEVGSMSAECTLDADGSWRNGVLTCGAESSIDGHVSLRGDLDSGSRAGAAGASSTGGVGVQSGLVESVGFEMVGGDHPAGTSVMLIWKRASGERVGTYPGTLSEPVRVEDDPDTECLERGSRQTIIPD